jgi:hypothetical protein
MPLNLNKNSYVSYETKSRTKIIEIVNPKGLFSDLFKCGVEKCKWHAKKAAIL